jgi:pimeloyl-ACP methyl ester carboxylesterase
VSGIARLISVALAFVLIPIPALGAPGDAAIESRAANVDGLKIHYLVAGHGEVVILLHGYTQTSDMWRPLIPSLAKRDRARYTAAYAEPGRMRAGWAYFVSLPQTAIDFARLAKSKLALPVLVISGAKAGGTVLGTQLALVASDVTVVVLKDTGHWVLEERPAETVAALTSFLNRNSVAIQ